MEEGDAAGQALPRLLVDQLKPPGIQEALERALASGRPAVVDVATDPQDSEAPIPWAP